MSERGLATDFSRDALAEVKRIVDPPPGSDTSARDLRGLPWCSIDNDDSRDLDQLTVAEPLPGGAVKTLVAVADVDSIVKHGSALDDHAHQNTTTVYTAAQIFPMLPEELSTDLTSLNEREDRLAIVVEAIVESDGSLRAGDVYRARVRNQAKLAYDSVSSWLRGAGPMLDGIAAVKGLAENLRLQDEVAQKLKELRAEQGALDLETIEPRAVFEDGEMRDLVVQEKNRARELIEDFMIAANGITARFLASKRLPSLRRVVRSPERWARIVDLAAGYRETLPLEPDARALENFLRRRRIADEVGFPDLSLTVVKLLGKGEYVAEGPEQTPLGHFGLAVRDYTHSTAPNRRYPDLITQRLLKAALDGAGSPYSNEALSGLARHCTEKEDDANRVERLVRKAAAACLLANRIGERFDGIVTGASKKGTWVRIFRPPVEGKLEQGWEGLDVGDRVRVKLVHTDVERGFIDLARA